MNKEALSLSHKSKETLRLKAVRGVIEKGLTQKEAANLFGVARQTVCGWIKKYNKGGYKALKAQTKGRPKASSQLKPWQSACLVKIITDKTPDQLKFSFILWTRDAVSELIERKYNVKMSRWTVGRLLKRWGLTPQKPTKKSYFQDDKKVKKWLNEEYPEIKRDALRKNAEIQWLDEMGARSDDQIGRTYGKKGQTPNIPVSGVRFSCNFISTISNLGKLRFMSFKSRFTSDVFIDFLKRLVKGSSKKIYLIIDSHPVHKSKKVTSWIKKNNMKIKFFFLPPYSPELNPTEYLNQDTKTNAVRKKRALTQKELVSNISSFLRKKQKSIYKVKKYFCAKKVKYAA